MVCLSMISQRLVLLPRESMKLNKSEAIESLPSGQEHLIRCEIRQFLATLDQVQKGYRISFTNEETRILENLKEEVCPV